MDNESYQKYLKIKEEVTKQSYKILLEAWCFIPVFKEVYHTFKNFQIFQVNILMYGWQHNEHKMKPDRKYLLGIKEIKDFYPAPIKIKKPRLIKVVFNSWQIVPHYLDVMYNIDASIKTFPDNKVLWTAR